MADNNNLMSLEQNRIESFKNWPYEDDGQGGICTAKRMAEAGFYSCGSDTCPDLVRCYVCFKELEGWDPTDDPWAEHKSHSASCAFVKKGKPQSDLTVEEFMNIEMASQQNKISKDMEQTISGVEKVANHVRTELEKLARC